MLKDILIFFTTTNDSFTNYLLITIREKIDVLFETKVNP